MQHCDTVIFLDYSAEVCLSGVRERKGRPRSDMPWTDTDGEDLEFLEFIKNYNTQNRPQVLELLEKYNDKEIHIFKSRFEADKFLNQIK